VLLALEPSVVMVLTHTTMIRGQHDRILDGRRAVFGLEETTQPLHKGFRHDRTLSQRMQEMMGRNRRTGLAQLNSRAPSAGCQMDGLPVASWPVDFAVPRLVAAAERVGSCRHSSRGPAASARPVAANAFLGAGVAAVHLYFLRASGRCSWWRLSYSARNGRPVRRAASAGGRVRTSRSCSAVHLPLSHGARRRPWRTSNRASESPPGRPRSPPRRARSMACQVCPGTPHTSPE
jgi:hypothetical protein